MWVDGYGAAVQAEEAYSNLNALMETRLLFQGTSSCLPELTLYCQNNYIPFLRSYIAIKVLWKAHSSISLTFCWQLMFPLTGCCGNELPGWLLFTALYIMYGLIGGGIDYREREGARDRNCLRYRCIQETYELSRDSNDFPLLWYLCLQRAPSSPCDPCLL